MASPETTSFPDEACKKTAIELIGLPPDYDEYFIELFFENDENFGQSIDINRIYIDRSRRSAVLVLQDPDDVDLVISKQPFEMEDATVTAKVFTGSTVEVSGPPDVVCEKNEKKLHTFFKIRKRSGGGPVEEFTIVRPGIAMVTYKAEEDAKEVSRRQQIEFYKCVLDVRLYHPKNYKSKKVVMKEIPDVENIDEEYLELVLEDNERLTECLPEEIEYKKDSNHAVLTFKHIDDVERFLDQQPITIDGTEVKLTWCTDEERVEDVFEEIESLSLRTIEVSGPQHIITQENKNRMQLYFSNERRSGGGHIVSLDVRRPGLAYITFETEDVAQNVVTKSEHIISNRPIEVKLSKTASQDRVSQIHVEETTVYDRKSTELEPHSQNKSFKVSLTDLPANVTEEFLKQFIEKKSGGKVLTAEVDQKRSTANVALNTEEAFQRIMQQKRFKFKDKMVTVHSCEMPTEEISCIQVRCTELTKETFEGLKTYFNDESLSGGRNLQTSFAVFEKNTAYFKFQDGRVAEYVCKRHHSEQGITVSLYEGDWPVASDESEAQKTNQNEDISTTTCIKVSGVSASLPREMLRFYFENKARSGGGPVSDIADDFEDKGVVFVTFEDHEVAKKVSCREHKINDQEVKVSLYVKAPYDPKRFLLRGIPEEISTEHLLLLLEARAKIIPTAISYHADEPDCALITVEEEIDFAALETVCREKGGVSLKASRVSFSNAIRVGNLTPNLTTDTVLLYFESKNGGGGHVEKVIMNPEDATCLVYFENYEDVEVVLAKEHKIGQHKLCVSRFYSCIASTENECKERRLKVPMPVEVNIDKNKMTFIKKSKYREEIEEKLRVTNSRIFWPNDEGNIVTLECTLTDRDKDAFRLAREWQRMATGRLDDCLNEIEVCEVKVHQKVFKKCLEFLKTYSISAPDEVCLVLSNKEGRIEIVGKPFRVESLKQVIQNKVDEITKELSIIRDSLQNIPDLKSEMLRKLNYAETLHSEYTDLKVSVEKNEVVVEGTLASVRSAKEEIKEKIRQFEYTSIGIPAQSLELYCTSTTGKLIENKLEQAHVLAVWKVANDHIEVCCISRENIKQSSTIIEEAVKEKTIYIDDIDLSETWKEDIDKIARERSETTRIAISGDNSRITVFATENAAKEDFSNIQKYIEENTIVTESIQCEWDRIVLITKCHRQELENVFTGFENKSNTVTFDEDKGSITLICLQLAIDTARARMNELLNKVKVTEHTVDKPGLHDFMMSERGKHHLEAIETKFPCRVAIEGQSFFRQTSKTNILASCSFQNTITNAEVTDITEADVEIIVNPSDEQMKLLGGLGRIIAAKAGDSIKTECRRHGNLKDLEVFVSGAGNLKCQHVAHIKSNQWYDGGRGEKQYLEEIVFLCLIEADRLSLKSIAIPAIGCGVNSFPIKESATCITQALRRFLLEKQDTSIRTVYLCDTQETRVQGFANALRQVFGEHCVQAPEEEQILYTGDATQHIKYQSRKVFGRMKANNTRKKVGDQKSVQNPRTVRNITINVEQGEIAQQDADAIVNTTSRDLKLTNGAVSQSILKAAGHGLQDEVNNKYPNGLQGFKVATSSGHRLRCKSIMHTSISQSDKKNMNQNKKNVKEIVTLCLEEAEKSKYKTIAFPAIGTGNLGYAHDLVAEQMFEGVSDFSTANPQTSVNEVRFVLYPLDKKSISAFQKQHHLWKQNLQQSEQHAQQSGVFSAQSVNDMTDYSTSPKQPAPKADVFKLGLFDVGVKVGDLTEERIDCIVNVTNENLDLKRETLSKHILAKCGRTLEEELEEEKTTMKTKKICCTSATPLPCECIIHVVIVAEKVADAVKRSLEFAEQLQKRSIGLPAMIGGRQTTDRSAVAKEMVKGIQEFAKVKPKYLKEIRFVLFDNTLLGMFQAAAEKAVNKKAWFQFWKSEPKPDQEDRSEPLLKKVTFKIYSLSDGVIENVMRAIDDCLNLEMMTKTIKDEGIIYLDDQVPELQAMLRNHHVHVKIDDTAGEIIITGIKDNVQEASVTVISFLKEVSEMEYTQQLVQWSCIEIHADKQEVVPYPKELNRAIERAFRKNEKAFEYSSSEGQIVVDFDEMEEKPLDNPKDVCKVIRRDLVKGGNCDLPPLWDDMKGGNIRVVTLKKDSQEFIKVSSDFEKSSRRYRCIIEKIDRIQTKSLFEQYQAKKNEINDSNKGQNNELQLWHGTSEDVVDSINQYGFNRSFCGKNATKFGQGVYFAVDAEYSCRRLYSKPDGNGVQRIYFCRVLTGDYEQGDEDMRVPPINTSKGRNFRFHSVVDNMRKPSMYVIFHDSQAYPEYLIYFKRTN